MKFPGFIGPSYTLQSTNIQAQRCINLYPQMDESGTGKNVAALLATPGLKLFASIDAAHPSRGLIVTTREGRIFSVNSNVLWEVFADGTKTNRGTLSSSAGFVGIADNGSQLMLVDGPNGYTYNLAANTLSSPITDFPGGGSVAFQDSFFIFNKPGTQQFYVTSPFSTTVDPTQFASKEGSPDNIVYLLSDHELLWLFGSKSTEVWWDAGNAIFPFSRLEGGVIQFGTVSSRTPCRFAGSVIWLSEDENGQGVVVMAEGLQPVRVSTHAIEQEIATYPTISDATAYTYQQDGHQFYVLNFPSGNTTWVFDAVTQLWHQRAYTGSLGLERQRGDLHVEAFGKHIVSDYQTGVLYQLDRFTLNDNGARIAKTRTSPYIADELKNNFIRKFQLDMQTGIGPDGVPTGNPPPQVMLQYSDDGGHKWSNEYWVSAGAIGETLARVIWRRLGRTRQRIFKVTITDDCPVAMIDAFLDLEEGTS